MQWSATCMAGPQNPAMIFHAGPVVHLLQARRPTATSSKAVAMPSLATAPSTMPVAGAASVLWNRLAPTFLIMGYPPAKRPPSLSVTGSSVAGVLCWPFSAAGSSTSTPAEAVIDLHKDFTAPISVQHRLLTTTARMHASAMPPVCSSREARLRGVQLRQQRPLVQATYSVGCMLPMSQDLPWSLHRLSVSQCRLCTKQCGLSRAGRCRRGALQALLALLAHWRQSTTRFMPFCLHSMSCASSQLQYVSPSHRKNRYCVGQQSAVDQCCN